MINFNQYSNLFLKIKTKSDGVQPFRLREYQKSFIRFWDDIKGPRRIIVLKPRQAGFSTLVAGKLFYEMGTKFHHHGLAMADKHGRTQQIAEIYRHFLNKLPGEVKPMVAKDNEDGILFDNPSKELRKERPGLDSGLIFETANDPNAGRSGTRQFAHWSETAFCRYHKEIDDGIQNSIPLTQNTAIIKESTANGRSGDGAMFYQLWLAAKRGESLYKPFFVAWHEVDDYQIEPPRGFQPTKYEREILHQHPSITEANLVWRRMKLMEYLDDEESEMMSPEERFKQDFPVDDNEAFLSTGAPVFDPQMVNEIINGLNGARPANLKDRLSLGHVLNNFSDQLRVFAPPRKNAEYFIGADVSEGLANGDASSVYVMNREYRQVASWHGKIDADMFGHLLIDLAILYNNAFITVEKNNMGHTTVTTIKHEGYSRVYKKKRKDHLTQKVTEEIGWVTTKKSKQDMLNEAIAMIRERECQIFDIKLAEELSVIAREENGGVNLNGRDRVVAFCLALMGRKDYANNITVKEVKNVVFGTGEEVHREWERKNKNRSNDFFG